jgi:homopolymeric O-antigen transport system permease protein
MVVAETPAEAVALPHGKSLVASAPIHVIEPWRPGIGSRLLEVLRHRRLLFVFGKEYLMRRVRNTYLGWLWLPLRPGIDILTKAFFFGGILGAEGGDRPYIIFFTFGSCGWIVFERVNFWSTRSMKMSNSFVRRAYAPRLPRLFSVLIPAGFDFLLYVLVALIAVVYYVIAKHTLYLVPSITFAIGCLGIGLLALWGLAIGLFTSPLSAYTKDLRYSFGYVTQFWYFITPIAYPISQMPAQYQPIAELNPITAPIEMVKYGFLNTAPPTAASLISCFAVLSVLLVFGLHSFSRFEAAAVDRL